MKKLIAVFFLMFVTSSYATEWVQAGVSQESTLFIDKSSIQRSKGMVTFWSKFIFKEKKDVGNGLIDAQLNDMTLNCAERLMKENTIVTMLDGKTVRNFKIPVEWVRVVPDSPVSYIYEIMCQGKHLKI
jgi:hypothetical protein